MTTYTVEVRKIDNRCKAGTRHVTQFDVEHTDAAQLRAELYTRYSAAHSIYVRETWVQRRNLQSGNTYWERFDTPVYCSPAHESYYSM